MHAVYAAWLGETDTLRVFLFLEKVDAVVCIMYVYEIMQNGCDWRLKQVTEKY